MCIFKRLSTDKVASQFGLIGSAISSPDRLDGGATPAVDQADRDRDRVLKAAFPSKDLMDMKAMMVERAYGGHCKSGSELLKLLPEAHPVGRELLVPLTVDRNGNPARGSYTFPGKILKELPTFEWDTLYKI